MTASASRLFAVSLLARLPLAMLGIGLLVHTEHATGSYGLAGLVSGAFALAQGMGGPVLGCLVDRRGQTVVLGASALVASTALVITASLPDGTPMIVRLALAVLTGLATPPV